MSLFRIDVLDASGNQVGTGPITNIKTVRRVQSLDKIGSIEFDVPATDPATAIIGAGKQYKLYHADYGYLGTYLHASTDTTTGQSPALRVTANDTLVELARKSVYFRRTFDSEDVEDAVETLIELVTDWSAGSVETGIGTMSATMEAESVFEAIADIANTWGRHFRLGTATRTLDFGEFGSDSGIRLIRPDVAPPELERNDSIGIISDMSVKAQSDSVVNRLIPVGAGTGTTQLTLEYCTVYDAGYPVETGTNPDGSSFWYIEDSTSQTEYGLVEKPFAKTDIRPLANSLTSLQNAANELYQSALAALLKWKDPRVQYGIAATKIDSTALRVGDTVQLAYRGIVTRNGSPYKWLDIDDDLYILDISEAWRDDGAQEVRLTVATEADRQISDEDIITSLIKDTGVFKTHVQSNLTKDRVGPYIIGMDSTHNATFRFEIGEETLALNYAFLRFKTDHFRSNVKASDGESSHTHSVALGNHFHGITIGTHQHGITIGTHQHGVTIGTHQHGMSHSHTLTVQANGGSYPIMHYNTISNVMASESTSSFAVPTSTISKTTSDSGGGTVLTAGAGGGTVLTAGAGGGTVLTAGAGGGTVTATAGGSEHSHALTYGFYDDTDYPDHISLYIDGTDRTTALNGGTWADDGNTVTDTVDITTYLESQSTLRGTHTIEFRCTGGQGEIEAELVMLMQVQAIAVT